MYFDPDRRFEFHRIRDIRVRDIESRLCIEIAMQQDKTPSQKRV